MNATKLPSLRVPSITLFPPSQSTAAIPKLEIGNEGREQRCHQLVDRDRPGRPRSSATTSNSICLMILTDEGLDHLGPLDVLLEHGVEPVQLALHGVVEGPWTEPARTKPPLRSPAPSPR